ncbi:MAG: class I SAM-dependent methyltransferase [Chloroflexi bacterium]|nr:class I SAM-dependent methyltransferase [Chloroflexota bacterium]
MLGPSHKNRLARRLFNGVARGYEGPARFFSLFQYRRWQSFLVSRLAVGPHMLVLDVATGTGLVAMDLARTSGARVLGLDLAEGMIEQARRNLRSESLGSRVSLLRGRAEGLPFSDGSFDAVVFTFLLRYVDDPQATLTELARVLRPGGRMASLEFFVPQGRVLHGLWLLHTRVAMPLGTRLLSPGWRDVASFLGPSISNFYRQYTLDDIDGMWRRAGIGKVRSRVLSLGGAVVTWGQKEAIREN